MKYLVYQRLIYIEHYLPLLIVLSLVAALFYQRSVIVRLRDKIDCNASFYVRQLDSVNSVNRVLKEEIKLINK